MRRSALTRRDFIELFGIASLSLAGLSIVEAESISRELKSQPLPNILLLVFDTLSARDMSLYGYQRQTTPNFERFADQATVYHRHYSPANFTTPGTASLLTGVYPWTHRAIHLQGQAADAFADSNIFALLPEEYHSFAYTHNTLVQILLEQFHAHIDDLLDISDLSLYSDILTEKLPLPEFATPFEAELLTTKNFYSVNSSLFISIIDELQRKRRNSLLHNLFKDDFPRGLPNCRLGDRLNALCFTVESAVDWINQQVKQRPQPYFGYIHLLPPHSPYNPRREFIGKFKEKLDLPLKPEHHFTEHEDLKSADRLRRRYDETIAYVDAEFGRLIDLLNASNALNNTCLIVTSDHGEIIERGVLGHNNPLLYEQLIQIPLLIAYPGQKARIEINQPTSAIDLVPTLLNLTGAPQAAWLEGDILPKDGANPGQSKPIFALDAKSNPKQGPLVKATCALVQDRYKLIYYRGYEGFDGIFELYDLDADPEEVKNIYSPQDNLSLDLKKILLDRVGPY
jgi:arylsulfatase A-like enzyme